jgi:hypothetical protein
MAYGQNVKIKIPKDLVPEEREALADRVVDFIRDRTEAGLDKNNYKFPKYSKSYIKSLDFRIARKSSGKVNLRLTGDMMAAMDVLKTAPGEIVIG